MPTSIELSYFDSKCHSSEREGAAHPHPSTIIPACLRTQRTSSAEGTPLLPSGASSRIFQTCYSFIYTPRACPMRLPTTRNSRLLETLIARVPSPLRCASPMPAMLAARVTLTKPEHTSPYTRPGNSRNRWPMPRNSRAAATIVAAGLVEC